MKSLYKGYIKCDGKKSLEKFKGVEDFKSYEEIKSEDSYAGVLQNDTVFVDVDDEEQSEILLKIVDEHDLRCKVVKTKRGMHFTFKNSTIKKCYTHTKLAIGLDADIKSGFKDCYEILKKEGIEYEIIYDIFEDEEYEEIPYWLTPIKHSCDFLELGEGDGRNQSLFNYILALQSLGFTKEQCRETISIINAYVLKSPLTQDELDTILRDEAFQADVFMQDGKFLFDKFAHFMISENNIININDQLHIYDEGVYVPATKKIEMAMIKHIPNLRKTQRKEVLDYIELCAGDNKKTAEANYIAFKNGIYDIASDKMIDFSPDIVITNKIDHNYVPDAYVKTTDDAINNLACGEESIRALLEEAIGYCFYRRNELGKAFILTGDKSNGKSTFLDIIKSILGDSNISALDLYELGDRFSSAMMFGKLANIADDISDEFMHGDKLAVFKKIVTGNRIKAERKGMEPFEFNPYCKIFASANSIPRTRDRTGALLRRLVIIPFNARFDPKDPSYDPYIKYKLIEESSLEYVISLGIEGLKRVLKNNNFTSCQLVEEQLEGYEEENNPIVAWIDETDIDEIIGEPTNDVYRRYSLYCTESRLQPMSKIQFSKDINKRLDLKVVDKKINGRKRRIFERR